MENNTMAFTGMSYVAILVAGVAGWIIGALYYSLLSKLWVAAQDKTMEEFKAQQAALRGTSALWAPFVISFIADIIMAWVLAGLLAHIGALSLRGGIISGAFVWFGFVVTTITTNYAFGGRRYLLSAIDSGHWLAVLIAMGAILGSWPV
jgi:hypothetical protein